MNKKILIIVILLVSVVVISFVTMFVNNINEDKEIVKKNIETINETYESYKDEVNNYNKSREDISLFINNFYYDKIENEYSNNLEKLNNYDEIMNKITNKIKIFEEKCITIYNDNNINSICNNYKNDYEIIVNVYLNDINNYNNKLNSYNKDNNKKLDLFKSKYINNYIDYNNDGIYSKKDEVNE